MNGWPTHEEVQRIKDQYPPGTRIRLNHMSDPWSPVPDGTEGIVDKVDDIGHNVEFSVMLSFMQRPPVFNNFGRKNFA